MRFRIDKTEPFNNIPYIQTLVQSRIDTGKLYVTFKNLEHGFFDLRDICGEAVSVSNENDHLFLEVNAVKNRNGDKLTSTFESIVSQGGEPELILIGRVDPLEVVEIRGAHLKL